jgi:hypothetical protein
MKLSVVWGASMIGNLYSFGKVRHTVQCFIVATGGAMPCYRLSVKESRAVHEKSEHHPRLGTRARCSGVPLPAAGVTASQSKIGIPQASVITLNAFRGRIIKAHEGDAARSSSDMRYLGGDTWALKRAVKG